MHWWLRPASFAVLLCRWWSLSYWVMLSVLPVFKLGRCLWVILHKVDMCPYSVWRIRSGVILCMHPHYGALLVKYVPVRVTWGTFVVICLLMPSSLKNLSFYSLTFHYPCWTICPKPYLMMWDWWVFQCRDNAFFWPYPIVLVWFYTVLSSSFYGWV